MMLTECLKCGTIMYDDNPSIDSRDYTDEEIEDIDIESMIMMMKKNMDIMLVLFVKQTVIW